MLNYIKKLVNLCEPRIENQAKKDEFSKSLKELVTILFAVVFATSLQEILKFHMVDSFWYGVSFWLFVLANLSVVLSWYGYHSGTIIGPKEHNFLCYFIDCSLVVLYWMLLNKRDNFTFVLIFYLVMFLLYFFWEFIRSCSQSIINKDKICRAKRINLMFFIITLGFVFAYRYAPKIDIKNLTNEGTYIVLLFIIIVSYRVAIHFAYKGKKLPESIAKDTPNQETTLIKLAKLASKNAKAHLSNYSVGAAIMAKNGKIYVGCNIEFDNYSNTIHAEEAALSALISDGESKFDTIAVFTSGEQVAFPCGMCRQSLFELGGPNLKIIACNETKHEAKSIAQLLPAGFKL